MPLVCRLATSSLHTEQRLVIMQHQDGEVFLKKRKKMKRTMAVSSFSGWLMHQTTRTLNIESVQ